MFNRFIEEPRKFENYVLIIYLKLFIIWFEVFLSVNLRTIVDIGLNLYVLNL